MQSWIADGSSDRLGACRFIEHRWFHNADLGEIRKLPVRIGLESLLSEAIAGNILIEVFLQYSLYDQPIIIKCDTTSTSSANQ